MAPSSKAWPKAPGPPGAPPKEDPAGPFASGQGKKAGKVQIGGQAKSTSWEGPTSPHQRASRHLGERFMATKSLMQGRALPPPNAKRRRPKPPGCPRGELGIIPEKVFRALPTDQAPEKGGHGDAREPGHTPTLKPKAGVDGVHVAEVVAGVKEGGQGLPLKGVFRVPFQ